MSNPASPHDDELSALERQLRELVPAAKIDRDRLMFAAGLRAGRRRLRFAHGLLAVTSVACGALVALVVTTPRAPREPLRAESPGETQSVARAAGDLPPTTVPPPSREAPTNYQLLRRLSDDLDARIAFGREAVPTIEPDHEPAPPQYPRALLKRYLENDPGQL